MILYLESAGIRDGGNVELVNPWNTAYNTHSGMKFYTKNPEHVVDVQLGDNGKDLEVIKYPFTTKNIVEVVGKKEAKLEEIYYHAFAQSEGTSRMFTIDVLTMEVLTPNSFPSYSPPAWGSHNLFIFETEKGLKGFPKIYAASRYGPESMYNNLIEIQTFCSHSVIKPANLPTNFGKIITYILASSILSNEFTGDNFPQLTSIDIPTSNREALPPYLDTSALDIFAEKCEIHKVKRTKSGYVDNTDYSEEEPQKGTMAIIPIEDVIKEREDTRNHIIKSVLEKSSVNFSEMLGFGVEETLKCIPINDTIVSVNLDVAGFFKKMCIHEGKVHFVLVDPKEDWTTYIGYESEFFHQCTDDTFPRKINPSTMNLDSASNNTYIM